MKCSIYLLASFVYSLVSQKRDYNETLRLSDYFERPYTMDLIGDHGKLDALIRGLVTQYQKKSDSNVDREVIIKLINKNFFQTST